MLESLKSQIAIPRMYGRSYKLPVNIFLILLAYNLTFDAY
jgi:hypothetical protein